MSIEHINAFNGIQINITNALQTDAQLRGRRVRPRETDQNPRRPHADAQPTPIRSSQPPQSRVEQSNPEIERIFDLSRLARRFYKTE